MTDKSCDTCAYFALYPRDYNQFPPDEYEKKLRLVGTCRRRSPYHNGWPVTWGSYYCGDWKSGKNKKENEV